MEKGRWILAAMLAVCMATGQAFAAVTVDSTPPTTEAEKEEAANSLEKSLISDAGLAPSVAAAITGGETGKGLANTLAQVMSGSGTASKNAVTAILNSMTTSQSAAQNTATMTGLSGHSMAGAITSAGGATATAIGGSGGSIGTRLAAVHREMNRSINNVGSFDAMASAAANRATANRIWFSPFYVNQDSDARTSGGYAPGYEYNAWGATLGYDRLFGPIVLGASFTYSRGDYHEKNVRDDNATDNYGITIYGDYYTGSGFTVNFNAGYNYGDNDLRRWIANIPMKGTNHTNTWWVGTNVGYEFNITECLKLTPSVGLFWTESKSSAFRNRGTGSGNTLDQHIGKFTNESVLLPIDLSLEYTKPLTADSSVSFRVGGGYAYDFKNEGSRGTVAIDNLAPQYMQLAAPGRHSWNLNTGVKYRFNKFDIGVDYRYDGKSDFNQHRVSGTFGINF